LSLFDGQEGEKYRWLVALRMTDDLLDMFKCDLDYKTRILYKMKTSFGSEFGMSRPLKKQLDSKYRNYKDEINRFLFISKKNSSNYNIILKLLDEKNIMSRIIINEILKTYQEQKLEMELSLLLQSYIHMLMNRIFKSKNRLNEMVCYDFLYRFYKSYSFQNESKS